MSWYHVKPALLDNMAPPSLALEEPVFYRLCPLKEAEGMDLAWYVLGAQILKH